MPRIAGSDAVSFPPSPSSPRECYYPCVRAAVTEGCNDYPVVDLYLDRLEGSPRPTPNAVNAPASSIIINGRSVQLVRATSKPDHPDGTDVALDGQILCARPVDDSGDQLAADFQALRRDHPNDYLQLMTQDPLVYRGSSAPSRRASGARATSVWIPGLNTFSNEATQRAWHCATMLGIDMAQMHNGTQRDQGSNGVIPANKRDWVDAIVARAQLIRRGIGWVPGVRWKDANTQLMKNLSDLMLDAIDANRPLDVLPYSDSTIITGLVVRKLFHGYLNRHPELPLAEARERFERGLENITMFAISPAWSNFYVVMSEPGLGGRLRRVTEGTKRCYLRTCEVFAWGDREQGQTRDVLTANVGSEAHIPFFEPRADNTRTTKITYPSPYQGFQAHFFHVHAAGVGALMRANGITELRDLYDRQAAGTLRPLSDHQALVEILKTFDIGVQRNLFCSPDQVPPTRPLLKLDDSQPDKAGVVHVGGANDSDCDIALHPTERIVMVGNSGEEITLSSGRETEAISAKTLAERLGSVEARIGARVSVSPDSSSQPMFVPRIFRSFS